MTKRRRRLLIFLGVVGVLLLLWRFGIDRSVEIEPAISAETRTFTSDTAGQLHYYVDTSGDGTPLVLIHSLNAAASSFEMGPLFEHYRGTRPVYALDLPGFGFSERSDRTYEINMYVSAIVDLLQNEVGESADIVALSLGTEFASAAAVRQPELVNSLTLLSPTGLRVYEGRPPETILTIGSLPIIGQMFYDGLSTRFGLNFFLEMSFAGEVNSDVLDYAYKTSHQPGAKYAPFHFVGGKLFNYEVTETVYKQIERPTLVLYDQDPNVSFDLLPEVLEQNDNWQAVKIQPTQGLPHWEEFDATVNALDQFLAEN